MTKSLYFKELIEFPKGPIYSSGVIYILKVLRTVIMITDASRGSQVTVLPRLLGLLPSLTEKNFRGETSKEEKNRFYFEILCSLKIESVGF